jgi:hypothetical protein
MLCAFEFPWLERWPEDQAGVRGCRKTGVATEIS